MARETLRKDPPPPLVVDFAVTRRCNLRCKHCYLESADSTHPEELTTSEAMNLVADIANVGARFLIFDGGEPLLREDIYQLVDHASRNGLDPLLNTNGTLLSAEAAIKLRDAGLQTITVGLKGHDAASHHDLCGIGGSWERALAGARNASRSGLRYHLSTCVTHERSNHVEEFAKLADRLEAETVEFYRFVPIGRGKEHAYMVVTPEDEDKLIDQIIEHQSNSTHLRYRCVAFPQFWVGASKKNGKWSANRFEKGSCTAGLHRCAISYDGSVLPCEFLRKKAGDVRQTSFADIWQHSEVLRKLRDLDKLEKKCGKCEYRKDCSGARCIAFDETGSLTKSVACSWFSKDAPEPNTGVGVSTCWQCGEKATATCGVCQRGLCFRHGLTCPVCNDVFCSPSDRSCIFSHRCEGSQ